MLPEKREEFISQIVDLMGSRCIPPIAENVIRLRVRMFYLYHDALNPGDWQPGA
jgi:hypothetical protein